MKIFEILPFLKSTRFWGIVLIGLSIWLGALGWMPQDLIQFIQIVCGGHIGLRTIDRFGENLNLKNQKETSSSSQAQQSPQ